MSTLEGLQSVGRNLTELARARAEQQRTAEDLTRLIDTANAPIIGVDAAGNISEWNQTAARITGFTKEEVIGHDLVSDFISDNHKAAVKEVLEKALLGEETSNYEFPLITKSGNQIFLLFNATSRRNRDETIIGVIGIGQDITARREQEEQLQQRIKLEALGALTGGIAHDFNNLLTIITGNLSLLEPTDGDEQEIVEDALKAARDGSELVRSLLAFSRRQRLVPLPYDLAVVLPEFQRSLARTLGETVSLSISTSSELESAFVDRGQFETALLNLCLNARDAIDRSGHIKITAHPITVLNSEAALFGLEESKNLDFIMVEITDDGCGIPEELLPKVTEPFFTTKEAGDGSGLGLSSVAGFVKQSGGGMRITSQAGQGTRVMLLLPIANSTHIKSTKENEELIELSANKDAHQATILIVDDEPKVRQVAARWLAREGHVVLQAESAQTALECLQEQNGEIDLLFTDIVMPGSLDGRDLATLVSRKFPEILIQLATGYEQERQDLKNDELRQSFPVISKPYDLEELSSTLRQLLLKKLQPV